MEIFDTIELTFKELRLTCEGIELIGSYNGGKYPRLEKVQIYRFPTNYKVNLDLNYSNLNHEVKFRISKLIEEYYPEGFWLLEHEYWKVREPYYRH